MIEWSPNNYPQSYVEGFERPDDQTVTEFAEYLEDGFTPEEVIVEHSQAGSLVHIRQGISYTQVNWSEPGRIPIDYLDEGFGSTFWEFKGPAVIQERRARMLAEQLDAELGTKIPDRRGVISIPSVGTLIEGSLT